MSSRGGEYELYKSGLSIPAISESTGIARSTLRFRFKRAGILRDRANAVRLAASQGKLGGGNRGKSRTFSDEHKANISKGKKGKGRGLSLKPNGYVEITMGENKCRGEHVVIIEKIIGRKLESFECVHHKDHVRSNNKPENLQLMTVAAHARLHALENTHNRERDAFGRFK